MRLVSNLPTSVAEAPVETVTWQLFLGGPLPAVVSAVVWAIGHAPGQRDRGDPFQMAVPGATEECRGPKPLFSVPCTSPSEASYLH